MSEQNKFTVPDKLNEMMIVAMASGELFKNYYTAVNIELKQSIIDYYDSLISDATETKQLRYLKKQRKNKLNRFRRDIEHFEASLDRSINLYKDHNKTSNDAIESLIDSLDVVLGEIISIEDGKVEIKELTLNTK